MTNKIQVAMCKGDGIGPEIMNSVLRIFKHINVPIDFLEVELGNKVFNSSGVSDDAKRIIEETGILFKGPLETPKSSGIKSINVTARKMWNTYANRRAFKNLPNVITKFPNIDITIIRENIEDTYGSIEHMQTHDVAQCRRLITRPGSLQVHRYAFELARKMGKNKVTCGHKANIMKITDGLFLQCFYEVSKSYPDIIADDIIVDDLAMKLVMKPEIFDIVVLPNLQGDIISDLCAGLVGGLGVSPSANIGDNICIFEAIHGTAPDIANQNLANPTALLLSGLMMLDHLDLKNYKNVLWNALNITLSQNLKTKDLNGHLTTNEFTDAIIQNLPSKNSLTYNPKFPRNKKAISHLLIKYSEETNKKTVGMDLFIDSINAPNEVANIIMKNLKENYQLEMISNRGTMVWPTFSKYTECVNHHRCRIMCKDSLNECDLLQQACEISKHLRICSLEMLLNIDNKNGYSLAQGQ